MRAGAAVVLSIAVLCGCVDGIEPAPAPVRLADDVPVTGPVPPRLTLVGVPSGVERFDLGAVAVVNGVTSDILIDIDDEVRSFTVQTATSANATIVVDRVVGPDGERVVVPDVDGEVGAQVVRLARGLPGPFQSRHRMVAKTGGGAFVVPATPAVALSAGTWRVRLGQAVVEVDEAGEVVTRPHDDAVQVAVLVDRRAGSARARLDVAFHFSGAGGLTAASADSDERVREAHQTLESSYAAVGIEVAIDSFDIDDGARFARVALDPAFCDGGAVPELLSSLVATPGAVDVVFVDRLTCVVQGSVVDGFAGLAAGVPGDVFVEGGAHGGVVVALGAIDGAERVGVTVAHELGHLLGLFHTREPLSGADAPVFDIIADTPDDLQFDENLLHFDPGAEVSLTADQGIVLRTNPWLTPL